MICPKRTPAHRTRPGHNAPAITSSTRTTITATTTGFSRGLFRRATGGGEATEQALHGIAAEAFPEPPRPGKGLLRSLGPLLRRPPDAPVVRPDRPVAADILAITRGAFLRPDRLPAGWLLVEAWLAAKAWGSLRLPTTDQGADELDFDLARVGVPPHFALGSLVNGELRLPLTALPGMATGYLRHDRAVGMAQAWRACLESLSPQSRTLADPLTGWLEHLATLGDEAARAGRPAPDVVAIYAG